ncbi:hypothetical protein EYC84_004265 [Monilinia fructicola]|uniref:Uncharacterized protein n=1 Tax=Monilinia fructicola TaxID=38448 RepID=A0A5M9K862_MONFR|nr:hypothetical protein EYC84_004265 [Monilinia fructicola]
MGKKAKAKTIKDSEGQSNGEQLWIKHAVPVRKQSSKKGPVWKRPHKVFVPAIPKEKNAWVWPSLPTSTTGSQESQKAQRSQPGGSLAKTDLTDSTGNKKTIRPGSASLQQTTRPIPGPGSNTFVMKYYTNTSVPTDESVWEHPPPPTMTSSTKYDPSTLDPTAWSTVPENAKWFTLPSWVTQSPYVKETEWCTKKRAMAILTPQARPNPWGTVSTANTFPTPPQQENPNGVVANFGDWGVSEPAVVEDPNAPNSWENMTLEETSIEPKEKFPTLVNWPFTGEEDRFHKLASLGLFVENYKVNVFKYPKNDQSQSPLIRLLQVEGIDAILLKMIWENHSTVSALSRTSQKTWAVLMAITDIWDVTGGNYQRCEIPRDKSEFSVGVAPVVVVTPTRDGEPINYLQQVNPYTTSANSYRTSSSIMFHFSPPKSSLSSFLKCANSKFSEFYNCELIHLCDGIELLHIIQRDRGRGCERQVSLDFYPAYHVGPQRTYQVGPKKGERKVGEQHAYGVSWDDTGMYVDSDTRIAIWQEVCTIIQLAREQGIDFESKHTMFRKWLDKSPCLAVEATLKVIMSPLSDVENVIAHVAYGEFGGRIDKFQKSKPGKVPNKPEGSQWMKEHFRCMACEVVNLGLYFSYSMIRNYKLNDQDRPTCMSCKLFEYLNSESDHYKREKRIIIERWCRYQSGWNTNNLRKFLRVFSSRRTQGRLIRGTATDLDMIRANHEQQQIFHETDEVQRPINHQALGRRGHYGIRAPTVQEKEAIESGRIHSEWDTFRQDRINGHGQPTTFRGW